VARLHMLGVFALESSRSVACATCAGASIGVMLYTRHCAERVVLGLASNVDASLVFLEALLSSAPICCAGLPMWLIGSLLGGRRDVILDLRQEVVSQGVALLIRFRLLLPYSKRLEYKRCSIAVVPPSRVQRCRDPAGLRPMALRAMADRW
jgi:hypothetical protein